MSHLPSLLTSLLNQPLLIEPRFGAAFADVLARKLAGGHFTGAELHAELSVAMPASRPSPKRSATIAVIPIYGMIAQHAQSMGTSTESIGAQLDQAMADQTVDGILFDVDSPGGTINGVPELAQKISEAGKIKPTAAIANGMAASAAYWLASAANEIWATASGDGAGSIGVYTLHEDLSAALEKEGSKVTAISAGKYKLEGAPWAPLSEEAQAFLQQRVDEAYTWFTKDVALYRGVSQKAVRGGYGEGRVLSGQAAVDAGLVDRIGSIEDALARLATRKPAKAGMSAFAERERLALDSAAGLS